MILMFSFFILVPLIFITASIESIQERQFTNAEYLFRNFVIIFCLILIVFTAGFASSISEYRPGDFIELIIVLVATISVSIVSTLFGAEVKATVIFCHDKIMDSKIFQLLIGKFKVSSDIDF